MTSLEERLRDAFGAAAQTIQPDAVGRLRARSRVTRVRRLAPLAAAAAVAVIVVGASVSVPLLLSGHAPSSSTGTGAGAAVAVPRVTGMSAEQATAVLDAAGLHASITKQAGRGVLAGLIITQAPAAGTRSPAGATVTLVLDNGPGPSPSPPPPGPTLTINSTDYAVTITVPGSWQPTPGHGGVADISDAYDGASGWVELDAAEPAGLAAECTLLATSNVNKPFGLYPDIVYRNIDGRPGCLIYPSSDAPWEPRRAGGPNFQMAALLVEYQQPLPGGWGYLLISADPQHLLSIADSIQLHH